MWLCIWYVPYTVCTICTSDTSCALLMKLLLAECFQLVLRVPCKIRTKDKIFRRFNVKSHRYDTGTWTHGHSTHLREPLTGLRFLLWRLWRCLRHRETYKTSRDCFSLLAPPWKLQAPPWKPRMPRRPRRRGDSTLLPPPATHAFAQMAPQWLQPSQDRLSPT